MDCRGRNIFEIFFLIQIHASLCVADMSEEEAYELLKKCVREIKKRLIVNLPNFKVQLVDKNGIRDLPAITTANLPPENPGVPAPEVRAI